MEILPVDPELLAPHEHKSFGAVHLPHFALPESAAVSYRIVYNNGEFQDVEAHNASHAYQLATSKQILRIEPMKSVMSQAVDQDVLQKSEHQVTVISEIEEGKPPLILDDLAQKEPVSFELLSLTDMHQKRKQKAEPEDAEVSDQAEISE